jgi:transcriptional regulator with XRE-family HTH domain
MSLTRNVSTQLVERRVALGLSRRDAVRLWGYGRATIERLETGKSRYLSLDKIAEYADALGVDVKVELQERPGFNPTPPNAELNTMQYSTHRFIKGMIRKHGRLPRLDELMYRLRLKTVESVRRSLLRLKDHGLISDQDVQTILKGV